MPVNVDPDGNADFDVEVLDDLDNIRVQIQDVWKNLQQVKKLKNMISGEFSVDEARFEQAADEANMLAESRGMSIR